MGFHASNKAMLFSRRFPLRIDAYRSFWVRKIDQTRPDPLQESPSLWMIEMTQNKKYLHHI